MQETLVLEQDGPTTFDLRAIFTKTTQPARRVQQIHA